MSLEELRGVTLVGVDESRSPPPPVEAEIPYQGKKEEVVEVDGRLVDHQKFLVKAGRDRDDKGRGTDDHRRGP